MKRLIAFVTIVAAAVALTGGTASATAGSATFGQAGITGCSTSGEFGTATWDTETSQGGKVRIRVHDLSGKTEYSVQIVVGCNLGNPAQQVLGTLKTNPKGNGSGSFTFQPTDQGGSLFRLVPIVDGVPDQTGTMYYTEFVDLSSP